MVFPSLLFQIEPGLTSQLTGFMVLAISFLLQRARKILVYSLILGVLVIAGFSVKSHAIAVYQGQTFQNYGTFPFPVNQYQNSLGFYGMPWGQVPPMYYYPSLPPYMGMMPNYYFTPHYPSPYGPGNYCPTCNAPIYPMYQPNFINQPHPYGPAS